MAAPGEWISARDENKRELHRSSVSEHENDGLNICVRAVIESLVEFGTKLNVSGDVLSIRFNASGVETSSLQLSHVQNCLQQHISKLQSVAENLKKIANSVDRPDPGSQESTLEFHKKTLDTTGEIVVDAERVPSTSQHNQAKINKSTSADNVQITAGKSEIERRISAFIERKQLEINENNVREFCNVIDCNQEDSCARTDAVFTPFPGFKSHVKVTRVVNTYGPQTRGVELGDQNQGSVRDCGNPAIEERLHNMESHLKLPAAGPVPRGVYQRLKKLEDRILELEGLSPEYFHSTNYSLKRPKASMAQSYTLAELDGKINAVKAALLKRTRTFQPTDAGEFFY